MKWFHVTLYNNIVNFIVYSHSYVTKLFFTKQFSVLVKFYLLYVFHRYYCKWGCYSHSYVIVRFKIFDVEVVVKWTNFWLNSNIYLHLHEMISYKIVQQHCKFHCSLCRMKTHFGSYWRYYALGIVAAGVVGLGRAYYNSKT
jgi:hypothetical protein